MNAREAQKLACEKLMSYGVIDAKRESQLIFAHLLHCHINELALNKEAFNQTQLKRLEEILIARKEQNPLQYILGETEFMSLAFKVEPAVLIPRGDTERIVEAAIALLRDAKKPLIVDVCCGSGNIAVSLAYYLPSALVIATDISPAALKIAKENATLHHLTSRIRFLCGDLLAPIFTHKAKPQVIIANPPYIKSGDLASLQAEVQKEPLLALDGGQDGLDFYRRLAAEAHDILLEQGYLIIETGYDQKDSVLSILSEYNYTVIDTIDDYGGNHRGIIAQKA